MVDPQRLGLAKGIRASRVAATTRSSTWEGLAPSRTRWRQRHEEARRAAGLTSVFPGIAPAPPSRETIGSFIGLCVLVQFPDVPGTIAPEEVERFCNLPGYSGFTNAGSVSDYFSNVSGGKLTYKNVVAKYYTTRQPRDYYTNSSIPQPLRAIELITEALDWLKSTGFDFSTLTSDGAGYVYALNVYYAGPVVNNWAQGLWPHAHHLTTPYPVAGGKRVFDYQISNTGTELSLGTFCHENGHMICGFPDLYDYGGESSGVGAYCLMCYGPNSSPKNPTQVCAYLKYRAGWSNVCTTYSPDGTITLRSDSNNFLLLRKNGTEYYILENRYQSGRDLALPDSGLAIWHVDETGDNGNEQMTPASHYECSLLQADGLFDLEHGNGIGDSGDLYKLAGVSQISNSTSPSSHWWDKSDSTLNLREIGPAGSAITFRT
jgi:M6 family metalloprotease-like protein